MRKLASVQQVVSLAPIEGADAIEVARVLGWNVVVLKGEFRECDLGVFFEVDSVLPNASWSEFLGERKRLRTMKLRGQLSQGLLLPLDILLPTDGDGRTVGKYPVQVGDDVTDWLGVTQYIPPQTGVDAEYAGPFPSYIPKTDELRIQSEPGLLEELRGHDWVATLKLDGTSATYLYDRDGNFTVCSRNRAIQQGDNVYWRMAEKYKIADYLSGSMMALQGEIVGPGIQGNPLNLTEQRLYLFDIYDYKAGRYSTPNELWAFCDLLDFNYVPVALTGLNFQNSIESLLELAQGNYPCTSRPREGIVIREASGLVSKITNSRLSFKVLNNDYLLREK